MLKARIFFSLLLALALLGLQVGAVFAAPPQQTTTPITGTVTSIVPETDANGVTTVLVTVDDGSGNTQTVRLSVDTAVSLNLVTLDISGNPVVNNAAIGTSVSIDPTTVLPDQTSTTTEQQPVATALTNFFSSLLGVDYNTIMTIHQQGVGFGVIAQALFLTKELGGDTSLFAAIVEAKQSGDYSSIVLPDGTSPKNWGQFRKALLDNKENLGQIMSGHADNGSSTTISSPANGNGNGKNAGNNGQGQGKGKNNGANGNGHKP